MQINSKILEFALINIFTSAVRYKYNTKPIQLYISYIDFFKTMQLFGFEKVIFGVYFC